MKIPRRRARHNLILFILCLIYVFIIGLFDNYFDFIHYVYFSVLTLIFLYSILSIQDTRNKFLYLPLIMIILTWVSEIFNFPFLSEVTLVLSIIFFFYIIFYLVSRVASSKTVGSLEFLESINVYLLLGIAASLVFTLVYSSNHEAYNPPGEVLNSHADFIYYSFVTMTTLGYGDITPKDSLARSLSIFFSVAGQLYLTMIIAMLVGKYLGQATKDDPDT